MDNCPEWILELSDYIDGVAAPEICAEIDRHLQECPDCKVMVNTLEKTISLYREREEATDMPGDVLERLHLVLSFSDQD
jgi:predicted anti-sigma-YlaC factor YlaD